MRFLSVLVILVTCANAQADRVVYDIEQYLANSDELKFEYHKAVTFKAKIYRDHQYSEERLLAAKSSTVHDASCAKQLNPKYNKILQLGVAAAEELAPVYYEMSRIGQAANAYAVAGNLLPEFTEYKKIMELLKRKNGYHETEKQMKADFDQSIFKAISGASSKQDIETAIISKLPQDENTKVEVDISADDFSLRTCASFTSEVMQKRYNEKYSYLGMCVYTKLYGTLEATAKFDIDKNVPVNLSMSMSLSKMFNGNACVARDAAIAELGRRKYSR